MNVILLATYTPAALKGLMSGSDRKAAVESALYRAALIGTHAGLSKLEDF